jgi:hypothetical protein
MGTPSADGPPDFEEIFRKAVEDGLDIPNAGSLDELAIAQRVMYQSYRAAGFTTAQALYMVACAATGNTGIAPLMEDE